MFGDFDSPGDASMGNDDAFNLLQDLEKNTPDAIRRQRAHFRLAIKASVTLQPGNASKLLAMKVKGVTGDISEGGTSILFPIAPRVGDIYRLAFDQSVLRLPLTFARCVRCRLVREDAFEAGFSFFAPIAIPDELIAKAEATT